MTPVLPNSGEAAVTDAERKALEEADASTPGNLPEWTPTMEHLINRRLVKLTSPFGLALTDAGRAALGRPNTRGGG
jgi:hypothetical protein